MKFDPTNPIVKLCAEGMEREGRGEQQMAKQFFERAWQQADSPFEKCISAHYLARHQNSVEEKLELDKQALGYACLLPEDDTKQLMPSLYLNIGKCYEDQNNYKAALTFYGMGLEVSRNLSHDGYNNMIRVGLEAGLKRVS